MGRTLSTETVRQFAGCGPNRGRPIHSLIVQSKSVQFFHAVRCAQPRGSARTEALTSCGPVRGKKLSNVRVPCRLNTFPRHTRHFDRRVPAPDYFFPSSSVRARGSQPLPPPPNEPAL